MEKKLCEFWVGKRSIQGAVNPTVKTARWKHLKESEVGHTTSQLGKHASATPLHPREVAPETAKATEPRQSQESSVFSDVEIDNVSWFCDVMFCDVLIRLLHLQILQQDRHAAAITMVWYSKGVTHCKGSWGSCKENNLVWDFKTLHMPIRLDIHCFHLFSVFVPFPRWYFLRLWQDTGRGARGALTYRKP